MKKIIFSVSGYVLNEDNEGIEAEVEFDGFQGNPVYLTKQDGYFVFNITGIRWHDFLFKHFLVVSIRTSTGSYEYFVYYYFWMFPCRHIKVNIFPYSNRIEKL